MVFFLDYYNRLSKIFEEIDTDDDHRVDFGEFKRGIELLGENHTDETQIRAEFRRIDKNGGGYILFDEVNQIETNFSLSLSLSHH